jgi:TonB family protein
MLVNIYLEQPDYSRVSGLLEETYTRSKNRKSGAVNVYLPVAGQVIKGAEEQLARYKKLGFSISDPKLPAEAAADLDKWRKMLESIAEQAKEMSKDEKKAVESLAILEEAANARRILSRDEYEASAWRNAVEDTRELIAASQSKVTDVDSGAVDVKTVAEVKLPTETNSTPAAANNTPTAPASTPINSDTFTAVKANAEEQTAQPKLDAVASVQPKSAETPKTLSIFNAPSAEKTAGPNAEPKAEETSGLMQVGSLAEAATRKFPPTYPPLAKNARVSGVVKVEVTVDEKGDVAEAKATDGPEMLRRAAMDAIKRWKFKPATKDGQPVKMSGFVNFNFTL